MCPKFCFGLLGASVAAKNTDPDAFNASQLVSSFHFKFMCVCCGPFLCEALLVNVVFTESSSCIFKISVGSCQYFSLVPYQGTVRRVHLQEGCSFFSEEAKSQFRHAAIAHSEHRFAFSFLKHIYCWTLMSKHTVGSFRLLYGCSVKILGDGLS